MKNAITAILVISVIILGCFMFDTKQQLSQCQELVIILAESEVQRTSKETLYSDL